MAIRSPSAARDPGSATRPISSCTASMPVGAKRGRGWHFIPGSTIPVMTHMIYQGMFFIITPALICGAFAERMKFKALIVFMILWGTVVYCPLAHWIWGNGFLAFGQGNANRYGAGGAIDFAGGTVVHISSVFPPCLRDPAGQTPRLRQGRDAPAQYDLHGHRRRHALGGLVRLQCGQCAVRPVAWPPVRLQPPILRRRQAASPGRPGSGVSAASRASWGPAPAWSPAWPALPRPQAS